VVQRARDLGSTAIAYERVFMDDDVPDTPPVRFVVSFTGGLGGPFEITRFELEFEDQSSLRVVHQRQAIRAIAYVSYSGIGVIDAVWELANSAMTRGGDAVTQFIQLRRVRQRFGGSGLARLVSPPLPTQVNGLHVVRLRFEEPGTAFPLPDIRYFVLEDGPGDRLAVPDSIDATSPPPQAALGPDTRFAWSPLDGAIAYRVVFYARLEPPLPSSRPDQALENADDRAERIEEHSLGPLVAGVMIPGDRSTLALTPAIAQRLAPGQRFAWQVQAIAADGTVRGQSALREVRVPSAR
jgi:hypothetical protein